MHWISLRPEFDVYRTVQMTIFLYLDCYCLHSQCLYFEYVLTILGQYFTSFIVLRTSFESSI